MTTFLYAALLAALNTMGLFLIVVGLPGTWFILLATSVMAWLRWDERMISPSTLIALLVLAVMGEVVELIAGAAGAKRAGGTWRGSVGAIVCGIIGGIVGTFVMMPVIGSILGACMGAFLGALAGELSGGRPLEPALAAGRGAFVGRLLGTLSKLGVGVIMWIVALVASLVG